MLPVTVVAFRCRQIEKYTSVTVLLHPMILRSRLLQGEKNDRTDKYTRCFFSVLRHTQFDVPYDILSNLQL